MILLALFGGEAKKRTSSILDRYSVANQKTDMGGSTAAHISVTTDVQQNPCGPSPSRPTLSPLPDRPPKPYFCPFQEVDTSSLKKGGHLACTEAHRTHQAGLHQLSIQTQKMEMPSEC